MENFMLWVVVLLAAITVYRLLSRRAVSPKARVAAMLRRYRALERTGLSEQECLLQLLATRRDWKGLPHRFLAELVSRFRSKEDVMRFVSVSEDYGYQTRSLSRDRHQDRPGGGHDGGCLLIRSFRSFRLRFGGLRLPARSLSRDRHEDRPGGGHGGGCVFIRSVSAFGCKRKDVIERRSSCRSWRYAYNPISILPISPWRLPITKRGGMTTRFHYSNKASLDSKTSKTISRLSRPAFSPEKCLGPDVEIRKLRNRYRKMYEACLKATEGKSLPGFYLLISMELLF